MAQASNNHRDLVCIDNLRLSANIGPDRWKKSRSQPLLVSVALHADLSIAGLKDELTGSINYGTLSKVIIKEAQADETRVFSGLEDLAENISRIAFSLAPKSPEVSVSLTAPKLLLYDAIAQLSIVRHPSSIEASKTWKWCINRWKAFVIIGLNPEEREEKQVLFTDLQMSFENENKTGMRVDIPSIINRAAEVSVLH